MAFPSNPTRGDTHAEYGEYFYFNGVSWAKGFVKILEAGVCVFDSVPPASPEEGLLFFDYTTNELKKNVSGVWTLVSNV